MRRAYVLGLSLLGCDPTAGLSDSADAALPEIKRYFDGRGSKLAEGPWNRVVVDLNAETLYHLGARRADDDAPTFHLFGADAREGCEVAPNAGTWLMGKAPGAPFRLLPFLESMDERGRGRLRFTQLDCTVQDLVIEDAGRPFPRLYDQGYLVPTKNGYTFAEPWRGKQREIAANLQAVLSWTTTAFFWADDSLKSFSEQFERRDTWGNAPVSVVPLSGDFLVEDADGLHRVSLGTALEIVAEPVLPDVCRLQRSTTTVDDDLGTWLVAETPCGSARPSLLRLDADRFEVLEAVELPFEADARYARPILAQPTLADEPLPPGVVYLTDLGDDERGTSWVWRGDGTEPIRLGEGTDADSVFTRGPDSAWDGLAQVNHRTIGGLLAKDWLYFRWDGTTQLVAERVVRNTTTGEPLVNFDGVAGDLPYFDDDRCEVLAQGLPPYATEATSYLGGKFYARVDRFDGAAGRLRFGAERGRPGSWSSIGSGVPPEQVRFAWFMPALVFLEDWDAERGSGRLVAYNYELDARATISEGVSSFDLTSYPWDGVVYAVPAGKQQGLWFSKAK